MEDNYKGQYAERVVFEGQVEGDLWFVGEIVPLDANVEPQAFAVNGSKGDHIAAVPLTDEEGNMTAVSWMHLPDYEVVQNLDMIPLAIRDMMTLIAERAFKREKGEVDVAELDENAEQEITDFAKQLEGLDRAAAQEAIPYFEAKAAFLEGHGKIIPHYEAKAMLAQSKSMVIGAQSKDNPEKMVRELDAVNAEEATISHAREVLARRENSQGNEGPAR